jgi:hypothetical protein
MAYYDRYDDRFRGGYNSSMMGYRLPPYAYEREDYFYDPPVQYRQAPFYDSYPMQDYRYGGAAGFYDNVYRRGDMSPRWMDQARYHHNHQNSGGRYRLDRYEHGGHRGYDSHFHGEDEYMQHGNSYISSGSAVELYVPICCDKCERKLRKHLDYVDGVEGVSVDQMRQKVVVFGNVNPTHVLHRARKDKPQSEFWHGAYR